MPLIVKLEISDKDLVHFRQAMRLARKSISIADDEDIIAAAQDVLELFDTRKVPEFISSRVSQLYSLIEMVQDEEWDLPHEYREEMLAALAYFSDPDDLIPDDLPGLGYLDDAIMVELLLRDLRHQTEAYQDFCRFRDTYFQRFKVGRDAQTRKERTMARREQLYQRMYRRIELDQENARKPF